MFGARYTVVRITPAAVLGCRRAERCDPYDARLAPPSPHVCVTPCDPDHCDPAPRARPHPAPRPRSGQLHFKLSSAPSRTLGSLTDSLLRCDHLHPPSNCLLFCGLVYQTPRPRPRSSARPARRSWGSLPRRRPSATFGPCRGASGWTLGSCGRRSTSRSVGRLGW
jgi:hypothetical protein